jgi:hypothetical protein
MMARNWQYYWEYLSPDRLIARTLNIAADA